MASSQPSLNLRTQFLAAGLDELAREQDATSQDVQEAQNPTPVITTGPVIPRRDLSGALPSTPLAIRMRLNSMYNSEIVKARVAQLREARDVAIKRACEEYNEQLLRVISGSPTPPLVQPRAKGRGAARGQGAGATPGPAINFQPHARRKAAPVEGRRAQGLPRLSHPAVGTVPAPGVARDENGVNGPPAPRASQGTGTSQNPFAISQRYTSRAMFDTAADQQTLTPFVNRGVSQPPVRTPTGVPGRPLVDLHGVTGSAYVPPSRDLDLNILTLPQIKKELKRLGLTFRSREAAIRRLARHYEENNTFPEVAVPPHLRMSPVTKRTFNSTLTAILRCSAFWTDMLMFRPVRIDDIHQYVNLSEEARRASPMFRDHNGNGEVITARGRKLRGKFSSAFIVQYLRDRGVAYSMASDEKRFGRRG